jgi:hypothetical protein
MIQIRGDKMGLKRQYIDDFFKSLKMKEDCIKGSCHGLYLKEAIVQFLEGENKKNAMDVYVTFFDSYKAMHGKNNFIDLLDILKSYEENAATLIDKQRDHYVHSVNVFLLGLAVYSQNQSFRKIIKEDPIHKASPYTFCWTNSMKRCCDEVWTTAADDEDAVR